MSEWHGVVVFITACQSRVCGSKPAQKIFVSFILCLYKIILGAEKKKIHDHKLVGVWISKSIKCNIKDAKVYSDCP